MFKKRYSISEDFVLNGNLVHKFSRQDYQSNQNPGVIQPGYLAILSPSDNTREYDSPDYSELALCLGNNQNGSPLFLDQSGSRIRFRTLSKILESGLRPYQVYDDLPIKHSTTRKTGRKLLRV